MRSLLICLCLAALPVQADVQVFDYRKVESIVVIDDGRYYMISKFADFLELRSLIAAAVAKRPQRIATEGESMELLLVGNGQQRIQRLGKDWLRSRDATVRLDDKTARRLHALIDRQKRYGEGRPMHELAAAMRASAIR